MMTRPHWLRSPRWFIDRPAPLRRLPEGRREVNGPGLPLPSGTRAAGGRGTGRPVVRGPAPEPRTVLGTPQPPAPAVVGGVGGVAGAGVPRRIVPPPPSPGWPRGRGGPSPAATALRASSAGVLALMTCRWRR